MADRYYGVCPKPDCNGIERVEWSDICYDKRKGCPKCGSELIVKCPNCHRYIEHKGTYCFHCTKAIKVSLRLRPQPGQKWPRKD